MRNILLEKNSIEDFEYWGKADIKILKKIAELFLSMSKDPFTGIGKPEALTGDLKGYWSRRINEEHRIVYTIRPGWILQFPAAAITNFNLLLISAFIICSLIYFTKLPSH